MKNKPKKKGVGSLDDLLDIVEQLERFHRKKSKIVYVLMIGVPDTKKTHIWTNVTKGLVRLAAHNFPRVLRARLRKIAGV
jgi:hypothetical protein